MICKIDMIRDEIEYNQERLAEIKIKRTRLLELLLKEIPIKRYPNPAYCTYKTTLPIIDWWRILEITMIEIWQSGQMD